MGNCYSSGTTPEIETSLANTAAARPNQRAQAAIEVEVPEIKLTKEEEFNQLIATYGQKLNQFVLEIQTSHPQHFRENVLEILQRVGTFLFSAHQPQSLAFFDL